MGRKRIDTGAGSDDRIVGLLARGLGPDAVAAELGVSRATAARRMREVRAGVGAARVVRRPAPAAAASSAPAPLPEDADSVPETTPLAQIALWLRMANEEVEAARASGDSDTTAKMLRIASTLLTLQQKHTPIAPPDPNLNPDFVAAAERVRKRWHELLDRIGAG